MYRLFLVCLCFYPCFVYAQAPVLKPAGGGGYMPAHVQCVTDSQRVRTERMLDSNRRQLIQQGKLKQGSLYKTTSQTFDWPLQQAPGFNYYNYYGISNYVDLDSTYPNHVLDWNCGARSYDLPNGYNHAGTDIFIWPFNWNMMLNNQVRIIAAAPGIIIGKSDGNPDHDCGLNDSTDWNAVYIQHNDGTVAWYGHMKSGTPTIKTIGDTVALGEYLGQVGSSGSSTGPHLHFEVHDINNKVRDPFNGPCNQLPSLWNIQKPYYESAVNTLMTHFAAPGFATCPLLDTINASDTFTQGSVIYFATYYHDQLAGQVSNYTVYRPDSSVYQSWSFSDTAAWYAASYWYWYWTFPAVEQSGKWTFQVQYHGSTYTHNFYLLPPTGVSNTLQQGNQEYAIYPNPARKSITIQVPYNAVNKRLQLTIYDVSAKKLLEKDYFFATDKEKIPLNLCAGIYFMQFIDTDGSRYIQKLVID